MVVGKLESAFHLFNFSMTIRDQITHSDLNNVLRQDIQLLSDVLLMLACPTKTLLAAVRNPVAKNFVLSAVVAANKFNALERAVRVFNQQFV